MNGVWPEDLVAVAEVLCPHGNKGEVKALPLTGRPDRFGELRTVVAWKDGAGRPLTLARWRAWRQFVVLGFAELTDIGGAETVREAMICIRAEERASLPQWQYYHDDLLGAAVMTDTGCRLGQVVSIMPTGANDVLVVRSPDGREVLLPALRSVIADVDVAARVLTIRPLPGLLD